MSRVGASEFNTLLRYAGNAQNSEVVPALLVRTLQHIVLKSACYRFTTTKRRNKRKMKDRKMIEVNIKYGISNSDEGEIREVTVEMSEASARGLT